MPRVFERFVKVRWRDTDALGHVNHAVFLTYLEEGRDGFYAEVIGDVMYVIVRLEMEWHAEVRQGEGSVTVHIEVERVGTTSLRTVETIRTEAGEIAAQAHVVTVRWDPDVRKPAPFSDSERERLASWS